MSAYKEFNEKKKIPVDMKINIKVLKNLYLLEKGSTKTKNTIKEYLSSSRNVSLYLSFQKLELEYENLCAILNKQITQKENIKTNSEYYYSKHFKKITRVKLFHSYWIDNHCVDFFIPAYAYVVEINGGVHEREFKMKKDALRDLKIQHLKMISISVNNEDATKTAIDHALLFKEEKRLCTSTVKRLLRNIYIVTLARHYDTEELSNIFDYDFKKLHDIVCAKKG